jgi:outer membrane protein assembly factor BamB
MRHRTATAVLVGCAVAFVAADARAQDWPQWLGPNRDAKATGFKAPKTWPKELTKKWTVKVGQGVATPALVGDRLYVFTQEGGDEVLRCLKTSDGSEVWKEKYRSAPLTGIAAGDFAGPRSSPAVADGKVVVLGGRGILTCFDAAKGTKLWSKDSLKGTPRFFASSSPILVNGLCIAQLGSEGKGNGGVVAYELDGGKEKWRWTLSGPAYASPSLLTLDGTKAVVVETENRIAALSVADGKLLWRVPFIVEPRTYNASTPLVHGQTIIYSGENRGTNAVKLEKKDGKLVGKELWNNDTAVKFNTPVLSKGLVFGLTPTNQLFCIDGEGKTTWTHSLGGAGGGFRGRGGYGAIVAAGPYLLVLLANGQLTVVEADAKAYRQVERYKVAEGNTYGFPVVSGNRVFVKDRNSVTLWTIE